MNTLQFSSILFVRWKTSIYNKVWKQQSNTFCRFLLIYMIPAVTVMIFMTIIIIKMLRSSKYNGYNQHNDNPENGDCRLSQVCMNIVLSIFFFWQIKHEFPVPWFQLFFKIIIDDHQEANVENDSLCTITEKKWHIDNLDPTHNTVPRKRSLEKKKLVE